MTRRIDDLTIHEWAAELTRSRRHREPLSTTVNGRTYRGQHVTDVPSLIDQLRNAGRPATGDSGAGGYGSRPVAHIEALDTLVHIDLEAARWVRDLGEDDPGDTADCVRLLHGLHASAEACDADPEWGKLGCCPKHEIERDFRRWWIQARIITGWDSPAWRPNNTCPACGKRGGLRVRLVEEARAGLCIECRATWDEASISSLALHIRVENLDAS